MTKKNEETQKLKEEDGGLESKSGPRRRIAADRADGGLAPTDLDPNKSDATPVRNSE
jgi:hypothetical protein